MTNNLNLISSSNFLELRLNAGTNSQSTVWSEDFVVNPTDSVGDALAGWHEYAWVGEFGPAVWREGVSQIGNYLQRMEEHRRSYELSQAYVAEVSGEEMDRIDAGLRS